MRAFAPVLVGVVVALSLVVPCAARAEGEERPRILVLDLSHSDSIDAGSVKVLDELLAVEMSRLPGFDVLSGADVRRLVELEAEKQSVGCADDASCLAEIAGAMGAQYVVSGTIGKLGTRVILTLTLYDSSAARSVNRVDLRAASIDEIADGLAAKVKELMAALPSAQKTSDEPVTRVEHTGDGKSVTVEVDPKTHDITVSASAESELSFVGIATTVGLMALGGCGFFVGTLFDLLWLGAQVENGSNGTLDPIDFVGPGIAVGGVATGLLGAALIPFLWWDEPDEDTAPPSSPGAAVSLGGAP